MIMSSENNFIEQNEDQAPKPDYLLTKFVCFVAGQMKQATGYKCSLHRLPQNAK